MLLFAAQDGSAATHPSKVAAVAFPTVSRHVEPSNSPASDRGRGLFFDGVHAAHDVAGDD
jgi:hypothetical protein